MGIYFLPQFLRKLICGLKFVIYFSLVELFVDARGRRLLPNIVNFGVLYLLLFSALVVIILYQCFAGISAEITIHRNSNIC